MLFRRGDELFDVRALMEIGFACFLVKEER
jgi:hypothetical protein